MARFRNRIVHVYWDIDLNDIYEILEDDLEDFNRFVKEITAQFFRSKAVVNFGFSPLTTVD